MAGLERFMDVLRLYTVEHASWTVQAMSDALGSPASTVYRAVGELVQAGLLEPGMESGYRLGAAFVEFDRLTRLTDPLMQRGLGVLNEIVRQSRVPCVGLLARLYGGRVMCIADAATAGADFQSSYERGRPMPLTEGATSKVILAHLPPRRLNALLKAGEPGGLRTALTEIRRRGFAVSRGEIDAGLVGLAAPIMAAPLGLGASLSLVVRQSDLTDADEHSLILTLVSAAALLTGQLTPA